MVAIIQNSGAGGSDDDARNRVLQLFSEKGIDHRAYNAEEGQSLADLANRAIEAGCQNLCACGGDGTVAEIANAIVRSGKEGLRLSVIPMGTGNVVAQALGIPSDPEAAVEVIAAGEFQTIDVGEVSGQYFLIGIGVGATERFVTRVEDGEKEKLGRLAYILSLFRHMRAPSHRVDITVDGNQQRTLSAQALTLASTWGTPTRKLLSGSEEDDGIMEVVVNQRLTPWHLLQMVWHGVWGRIDRVHDVQTFKGTQFHIATTPSMPVQLDGSETDLTTPVDVKVRRQALRVTVPS